MWNTGADDATGRVVEPPRFGEAIVRRDLEQHNGGIEYRVPVSHLWEITDPPYQRRFGGDAV